MQTTMFLVLEQPTLEIAEPIDRCILFESFQYVLFISSIIHCIFIFAFPNEVKYTFERSNTRHLEILHQLQCQIWIRMLWKCVPRLRSWKLTNHCNQTSQNPIKLYGWGRNTEETLYPCPPQHHGFLWVWSWRKGCVFVCGELPWRMPYWFDLKGAVGGRNSWFVQATSWRDVLYECEV